MWHQREEFMGFSEAFVTLAKRLFGHWTFDNSPDKDVNFQSSSRGLLRSQSIVEILHLIDFH